MGLAHPEASGFTLRTIIRMTAFVWTVAIAFNIPIFIYTHVAVKPTGPSSNITLCVRLGNIDEHMKQVYTTVSRVFAYFIPLAITWFSYAGIYMKITRSKRKVKDVL